MKCTNCDNQSEPVRDEFGHLCHACYIQLSDSIKKQAKKLKLTSPRSVDSAREQAIDWQQWISEQSLSYGELLEWAGYFETLGKKFNLTDEFKENGII